MQIIAVDATTATVVHEGVRYATALAGWSLLPPEALAPYTVHADVAGHTFVASLWGDAGCQALVTAVRGQEPVGAVKAALEGGGGVWLLDDAGRMLPDPVVPPDPPPVRDAPPGVRDDR